MGELTCSAHSPGEGGTGFQVQDCLSCGACTNSCLVTGTPGLKGVDVRTVLRMVCLGMIDEAVSSPFPWLCTGCGRCVEACPVHTDIPGIMYKLKSLRPRGAVPGGAAQRGRAQCADRQQPGHPETGLPVRLGGSGKGTGRGGVSRLLCAG